MVNPIRFLLVVITSLCSSVMSAYADYMVYHAYDGTVANFKNATAIAIKYEYDGKAPLNEALKKFFDGPTVFETEETGAKKPFRCISPKVNDDSIYNCGASDIFKSVRIEDGTAHIELAGVPSAPTSGQWMYFDIPFMLTTTQFENVSGYNLYVSGRRVTGLDWGLGCEVVCFIIPKDGSDLDEILKSQF